MKRILALLLAMIMTLSLCACGNNTADNTDGGMTANTESTTPTTPPTNTTETKECQHTNAFNVPNDDPSHPVPTCTADGYYLKYCPDCYKSWAEAVKALGHTGGTAKCTRKAVCSRCSNEYGEVDKNNHIGININCKEEAKEVTCETEGYEGHIKYCSFCDTVVEYGKTIPALGHLLTSVYDKATDKIKTYCQRQGCDGGKYTDIEPLRIELKGSLNIYGGCYPQAKCYYIKADGTRREHELRGWAASQDLTWCGYYWLFSCTKWELGNKIEICAYDNSGRTATAIYEVVETDSGGYTFQKVG